MEIVTRFAPSPTGFLHIGGARTALFNWLFARRHGGAYLLRIEDTDRARSTEAAIGAILQGLDWLGLGADGKAVFQFARAGRHREAAEAMVARGTAFRCYVSPEALEQRRAAGEAARAALAAAKQDPSTPPETIAALQRQADAATSAFRSPYRDGLKPPSPDAPHVIRLRAPDAGEIAVQDLVQGPVRWRAGDIDDLVLLRADATPTYMLAVVVDDHDMGVTHVIRGDDHLTNTARQIPIYQALDWDTPAFAHVPMIHGADGAKLSKRHGALGVEAYRDLGYLPEAINAYLMRLGWSPGHDEILAKEEASAVFDLAQIGRAPARLDLAKLNSVNAHFLQACPDARLGALLIAHIAAHTEAALDETAAVRVRAAAPVLKARAKTIADLAEQTYFLVRPRPIPLDAAAQKLMKQDVVARLSRLKAALEASPAWDEHELSAALKRFADAEAVGLGQFGPALRALVTGGAPAPDLGRTLALLGRSEALARLSDKV